MKNHVFPATGMALIASRFVSSLALAATVALLCLVPQAQAQLPNAWQITDSSTAASTRLHYTNILSTGLQIASTNSTGGFHFTINARMVDDLGGPRSQLFAYGVGNKRFIIWPSSRIKKRPSKTTSHL